MMCCCIWICIKYNLAEHSCRSQLSIVGAILLSFTIIELHGVGDGNGDECLSEV